MKISLNTINNLISQEKLGDNSIKDVPLNQLIDKLNNQIGGTEEATSVGNKYDGAIIVKIVSAEKHSNADRLKVCLIDDGGVMKQVERNEDGLVQVVCGAPNARAGMFAVWLPPGVTVPDSLPGDPFVLSSRDFRGETSNGMMASIKELALGEDHSGILEIDDSLGEVRPGADFARHLGLSNDCIIDFENKMFTHRPDLFGWLGIIREIFGVYGEKFTSPDWYLNPQLKNLAKDQLPLEVVNELPDMVQRFTAITMNDVKVQPSPLWLKIELAKIGQKSINNIVDLTNYFMLLTGQPLHAYDYDKVAALSKNQSAPKLVIRKPKDKETIQLLNGKEIVPYPDAIMIATDLKLIGLGGIMGGSETEVSEATKNIIIESATFDMYATRRTSMHSGIFSDAATRFTKGQSPLQNVSVLARIVNIIEDNKYGSQSSNLIDISNLNQEIVSRASLHPAVEVSLDFINNKLGTNLDSQQVKTMLKNVEFKVKAEANSLQISAPFFRTDISEPEDIVEEVGRLYGMDKIDLSLPLKTISPASKNELFSLKSEIRHILSARGGNELLTYSFVHASLLDKLGQDKSKAFQLSNALSPDLQYYRLSLMSSLLDKVSLNIKARHGQFVLFEMGKTHSSDQLSGHLPISANKLCLVFASKISSGDAYYQAKYYLDELITSLSSSMKLEYSLLEDFNSQDNVYFMPGRSASVCQDGQLLGCLGEFKLDVSHKLKLPDAASGFEIDLDVLMNILRSSRQANYTRLSKFPSLSQDITLKVKSDLVYSDIKKYVDNYYSRAADDTKTDVQLIDIYQGQDDGYKNLTFSLRFTNYDRTLTDKEINILIKAFSEDAYSNLSAEII